MNVHEINLTIVVMNETNMEVSVLSCTPKSSKTLVLLSIENHGDLGIHHFEKHP